MDGRGIFVFPESPIKRWWWCGKNANGLEKEKISHWLSTIQFFFCSSPRIPFFRLTIQFKAAASPHTVPLAIPKWNDSDIIELNSNWTLFRPLVCLCMGAKKRIGNPFKFDAGNSFLGYSSSLCVVVAVDANFLYRTQSAIISAEDIFAFWFPFRCQTSHISLSIYVEFGSWSRHKNDLHKSRHQKGRRWAPSGNPWVTIIAFTSLSSNSVWPTLKSISNDCEKSSH